MLKVSVRLTDEQKNQIQSLSKADGVSISEWIRKIVELHLKNPIEAQMTDLSIAESNALFETRFLTRFILGKLHGNQAETNHIIEQAKLAAAELFQKKLAPLSK